MLALRALIALLSSLLPLHVHSVAARTTAPAHAPVAASAPSLSHAALTRAQVFAAVSRYTDWSATTMTQLSWCESRWEPWVQNPVAVMENGRPVHSTGLLGVLGGSMTVSVNVAQAHARYALQGYAAWRGDFSDGCAYRRASTSNG